MEGRCNSKIIVVQKITADPGPEGPGFFFSPFILLDAGL
jgi:hypothetical protein